MPTQDTMETIQWGLYDKIPQVKQTNRDSANTSSPTTIFNSQVHQALLPQRFGDLITKGFMSHYKGNMRGNYRL